VIRVVCAVLVIIASAGCSAAPPASLAPSATPTTVPTPSPSPSLEPSPSGVDHDDCQRAIRAAHIFGEELADFAGATGDHDAQDDIVRETVELADASADLAVDERGPTMVQWVKLLRALHSAGLDYDNGDPLPFIDALGKAALYEYDLRPACA
jgi:hypothetical protein